jgi:hypothetical protein
MTCTDPAKCGPGIKKGLALKFTIDYSTAVQAKELPVIWMPSSYQVMSVSKDLQGVAFNPLQTLLPEYWYYTKS